MSAVTPDPAALAALLRELAQYDLRDPLHRLGPDLADAYAAVIAAPGLVGEGTPLPLDLVALVLEFQEAEKAWGEASPDSDDSDRVARRARIDRVQMAERAVLAWTPAAPSPPAIQVLDGVSVMGNSTSIFADTLAVPAGERDTRRDCTCLGTCKGAEGLGPGWRCALAPRAVQAGEPTPTAAEIAEHTRWRGQYP